MTKWTNCLMAALLGAMVGLTSIGSAMAAGKAGVTDATNMNLGDKASLQRGAALFVNYCLSCHSAEYARYNRVAEDLEIPSALLTQNLMFTTEKEGDLMTTTMPADDAQRWFGVAPPDLSLVARVRKPDWIYTYLRAFYQDESSPSGWNNSLFENVAMPHAMYELQGVQRLVGKAEGDDAVDVDALNDGDRVLTVVGDTVFELQHSGKMTPQEFDLAMRDLTAFLTYLAEPARLQRVSIGIWTMVFLIVLMGLCYLLNKEYWRDIK